MRTIRLAELLGCLSFAGDLGRGQPMGHVLRTTRIAMALADKLNVPSAQLPDVYFTSLLVHAGCTAGMADFAAFLASDELSAQKDFCLCDTSNLPQLFGWLQRNVARGKPLPARTLRMLQMVARGDKAFEDIEQGCSEVGSRIAARLGLSESTQLGLYHICETWNGKGPHKIAGEDIPLAGRIVNVAMIVEVFASERSVDAAKAAAIERKGKSFDPGVAGTAAQLCIEPGFWEAMREQDSWDSVLELEPGNARYLEESALDDFAFALADIVDLKSSITATHSRRTAELAAAVAARLHIPSEDAVLTRRAALVHDVGLVAVPTFLLEGGNKWSEVDFERFRLHTYYTERILSRSKQLIPIGLVGAAHHENIDGSGYHRGLSLKELSLPARIVAAASAYIEASENRPDDDADVLLSTIDRARKLDPDCLAALSAEVGALASLPKERRLLPAGLTEREVEVLRLVASGLNLKDTAERLVISDHTARHHLESVYSKAGVSSRAGVTLFAVEHGILS